MASLKVPVVPADHSLGDESAIVTLVEYGDYQCPHCAHAQPVVGKLKKRFGKQLRFVFRNFPLTQIHEYAEVAAEAAEFAGAAGHFWEMHDAIFENQNRLSLPVLKDLTAKIGLSAEKLDESLQSHEYLDRIKADFMGGVRSGVNGTPTFFINNKRYENVPEFEEMVEAIEEHIPGAKMGHRRAS
jgi:protein-disulfide isomerase